MKRISNLTKDQGGQFYDKEQTKKKENQNIYRYNDKSVGSAFVSSDRVSVFGRQTDRETDTQTGCSGGAAAYIHGLHSGT